MQLNMTKSNTRKTYENALQRYKLAYNRLQSTIKTMQKRCKHLHCGEYYEYNEVDYTTSPDYFIYRVCLDCGLTEQDRNESVGFSMLTNVTEQLTEHQYRERIIKQQENIL